MMKKIMCLIVLCASILPVTVLANVDTITFNGLEWGITGTDAEKWTKNPSETFTWEEIKDGSAMVSETILDTTIKYGSVIQGTGTVAGCDNSVGYMYFVPEVHDGEIDFDVVHLNAAEYMFGNILIGYEVSKDESLEMRERILESLKEKI